MTFRSIAVVGWGGAAFCESVSDGAPVGDGDCGCGGVDFGCCCVDDGVDFGCCDWCGDDFWSRDGDGAVGGFGPDVGFGADVGFRPGVGLGAGGGGGFASGVNVGLGTDGKPPPIETGVAAPRFVAGAIAAMWLAYSM